MRWCAAQGLLAGRRDLQRLRLLSNRLARRGEVDGRGVLERIERLRVVDVVDLRIIVLVFRVVVIRVVVIRVVVIRFLGVRIIRVRLIRFWFIQRFKRRSILSQSPVTPERKAPSMLQGFKEFILRGNVIDLAVAVVIGAAFTGVVTALVEGLFNPLIGALFNADSLATAFGVEIPTTSGGTAVIAFGAVLAAIINFLIIAVVVYFVFVLPINTAKKRADARKPKEPEEEPVTEKELLVEIRDLLAAQSKAN